MPTYDRIVVVFEDDFPLTVFVDEEAARRLVEARTKSGHKLTVRKYIAYSSEDSMHTVLQCASCGWVRPPESLEWFVTDNECLLCYKLRWLRKEFQLITGRVPC